MNIMMIHVGNEKETGNPFYAQDFLCQWRSLRDKGHDIITYSIDDAKTVQGIIKNICYLHRRIKEQEINIAHALFGSTTGLVVLLASCGTKAKNMITYGGSDLIEAPARGFGGRIKSRLANALSRFCARKIERIIIVSENLRHYLPCEDRDKAIVLPHGVDLHQFAPYGQRESRQVLELKEDAVYVLFNSGPSESAKIVKDVTLAKECIKNLRQKFKNASLLEIGSVPHDNVNYFMNAADVLLVTSRYEGSPNIVKEAMACNLPVVSVEVGDVMERLKNVRPGKIVARDPVAIAAALEEVIREKKRSNGREELLRQGLGLNSIADRLIAIYRDLYAEPKVRLAQQGCE